MRYIISICLSWLVIKPSFGQTNDLNPRSWFPLEVGSLWHYHMPNEGNIQGSKDVIRKSKADTTIGDKRWVLIEEIFCVAENPSLCDDETGKFWYGFTEDDYLLMSVNEPDGTNQDTLLATYPESFFRVDSESDTLRSPWVTVPIVVELQENEIGIAADTTNIDLVVLGDITFGGKFTYRIGESGGLRGAIVNGISYGDTTLISSFLLAQTEENDSEPRDYNLRVYPNPTKQGLSIGFVPNNTGQYTVDIVNLLGQIVWSENRVGFQSSSILFSWPGDQSLGAGLYFIVIKNEDYALNVKPFSLIK